MPEKSNSWQHTFCMQMRTDGLHVSGAREQMKMIRKSVQDLRKRAKISAAGKLMQIAERRRNRACGLKTHIFPRDRLARGKPHLYIRCRGNPLRRACESRTLHPILKHVNISVKKIRIHCRRVVDVHLYSYRSHRSDPSSNLFSQTGVKKCNCDSRREQRLSDPGRAFEEVPFDGSNLHFRINVHWL